MNQMNVSNYLKLVILIVIFCQKATQMKLDLNLFTVFDAIYAEGNLTKAAERLNLTQPAISHALAKLRDRLDDPLFTRNGHRMVPTPLAQALLPDIQQALTQLNTALQRAKAFDPTTAEKTFRIAMRDIFEATLLPPLVESLTTQAPNLTLASVRIDRKETEAKLASGELDFALDVLLPTSSSIRHQPLIEDGFVVIYNKQHSSIKSRLTEKQYLSGNHILVSTRSSGPGLADYALSQLGLNRKIGLRCQHYFAAAMIVEKTDLLLTMPARYGNQIMSQFDGLNMVPCPVPTDDIHIHLYWHESREHDEANKWLRQLLMSFK